jgi:MFS family permease
VPSIPSDVRADPQINDRVDSIFAPALRLTTIGLIIVTTMIAFEAMAVATALPTAARELHGLSSFGLAFTGFFVANIVGMVAGGVFSDRAGPRFPLAVGVVLFLLGLVMAGSAQQMWHLLAGRAVQGLGAGLLVVALYVVIGERFDEALRPKVFGAMSSAWVVPSLVGPPLSGFVTEHVSWRWVFLGLAPLVLLGGALLVPVLSSLHSTDRTPVGGGSVRQLVRAVALGLAIAELSEAGQHPRLLWTVLAPVAAVAVVWALRLILPPGTATLSSGVGAAVAMRGLMAGAMFGCDSLIPLAMSTQHGFSPTAAGLPLLVAAMWWATGSWWQGRSGLRPDRAALIRVGFVLVSAGCAGAAVASVPSMPGLLVYPAWALAGLGAGLAFPSFGVVVLSQTTDEDRGRDSAALQLGEGVATSFTTGFGGVLVAAAVGRRIGYTAAFVGIDAVMVAIALVGVLVAGRARSGPPDRPHRNGKAGTAGAMPTP